MVSWSRTTVILFLAAFALACAPPKPPVEQGPKEPEEPFSDKAMETETPEAPEAVLPFSLIVGEEVVGPELRCAVPEGQAVMIQYVSSDVLACEMRVQPADGEAVVLGSWQADTAYFHYSFPYGENHIIIGCADNVYDILVVAGAPVPGEGAGGCSGAYMQLSPDARFEFEETSATAYPKYWSYRVKDWTAEDSSTSLILAMDRTVGVERKPDTTVELQLVCGGDLILITGAVEKEGEKLSTTLYEDGTVFVPPVIREGVQWERHGTTEVQYEGETYTFEIVERFRCVGEESVSVQAGEFTAARVEYVTAGLGEETEYSYSGNSWYVPGLGRVLVMDDTKENRKLELVSYEGMIPR